MSDVVDDVRYLLRRDPSFRPKVQVDDQEGGRSTARRIRCPLCRWQPRGSELWFCADCPSPEGLARGCGTAWHTFDTGGKCPGCDHQWRWTTCIACERWSRHGDWYEDRH